MLLFSGNAATLGAASARPVRNTILQSLSPDEFGRLRPHLEWVRFTQRETIHRERAPSQGIFFIEEGLVARTVQTRLDAPFEIAMEGRSGVVGLSLALGSPIAMNQTTAIVAGSALKIEKGVFETLYGALPEVQAALMRHTHSLGQQISHLSMCNSRHLVEQRVPRWLLMARERLGADDIPVTQETIATLLGVRRPGVTDVLQKLREQGLIAKTRGSIRVLDASELANRSCICHRLILDVEARFRVPLHAHILPISQKPE